MLIFFLLGCQAKEKKEAVSEKIIESGVNDQVPAADIKQENPVIPEKDPDNEQIPNPQVKQKLIREADISFEVRDFEKTRKKILEAVKSRNGYISSENQDNNEYRINSDIVIRISNENFDKLIADLEPLYYRLGYKKIKTEDVTEEYVDIESRLKTKREVEKSYMDLLSRAKTIDEIIKLEEIIRTIHEEIEAKEGRLKYLNDRVAFSTINLNIYESKDYRYVPDKKPDFFQQIWKALHTGWNILGKIFLALLYIWPLYVIGGFTAWLIIRYRKRKQRSVPANKSNEIKS